MPNYIKYIFINVFFLFVFAFSFRFIFYLFFAKLDDISLQEIQKAFELGIRFDVKLATLILFPLAILILVVNYRFFKFSIYKKIASTYLTLLYIICSLFYLFDFGYYDYLATRLDATALRFTTNLKISTQVLFESYPVFKALFGFIILGFMLFKIHSWYYKRYANKAINSVDFSKKGKAIFIVSTILLLAFGVYNSTTHYPLRWSQAFFSKSNAVNQFALNPILYFFDSFAFRNEGVDIKKVKAYYPSIAKHLQLKKDTLRFKRQVTFEDSLIQKPNVVIVMLESVGTAAMGHYGNPMKNGTPKMDSILKQSTSFSNFFVHKAGTAASVFSSITGLPDIDAVRTASRNPMVIDQRIIFDQYKDYEKLYFLGGSANWANIRAVFDANINNLNIFEEGSYTVENRADVWGIDDYDLFKESNKEFAKLHQQGKSFIAYIQTATNHMPYTVPEKKEDYRPLAKGEVNDSLFKKSGFKSLAQFNALRYLDFNVNVFLERAKKSGYYENTIFAFFGDHRSAMNPIEFKGKNEDELNISVHHVPFFIHAPKYVQKQVVSKYAKLVDLFPTVTPLAKINHTNYTLGSNLLDSTYTDTASFVYLKSNGEPAVGLLQNDFFYLKTNQTQKSSLYHLKASSLKNIKATNPLLAKKMDSLLNGYYHSTKYLYYHNKKSME